MTTKAERRRARQRAGFAEIDRIWLGPQATQHLPERQPSGPIDDPYGAGAAEVTRRRNTQTPAPDAQPCGCSVQRNWTCPSCWSQLSGDEQARRRQLTHRRRRGLQ